MVLFPLMVGINKLVVANEQSLQAAAVDGSKKRTLTGRDGGSDSGNDVDRPENGDTVATRIGSAPGGGVGGSGGCSVM